MTSLAMVLLDTLTAWATLALRVIPCLLLGAATAGALQAYLTRGVRGWRFAVARVTIPFLVVPLLGLALNRLERSPGWRPVAPVMGGAPGAQGACRIDCGCADTHSGEPCRVAGPTAVPTMLMARRIVGGRATALCVGAWFAFAIGAGVLSQGLVGS